MAFSKRTHITTLEVESRFYKEIKFNKAYRNLRLVFCLQLDLRRLDC